MMGQLLFSNRKMSQLDYLMDNWHAPRVMTYPIPPYIILRINTGLPQGPPFPRPRLLLDMKRKFSSAKDGRYYISNKDEEESMGRKEVYIKGTSQISQIHDDVSKYIFYYAPSVLKAKPKQTAEDQDVANFEITKYTPNFNSDKIPITLRICGTNLYLTCSDGTLKIDPNDESLKQIEESTKKFLFFRTKDIESVKFESAMSKGMYLCTSLSQPSPLNMSIDTDQKKIVGFTIDKETVGKFVRVGNNRFALHVPMEILGRFRENNHLMANSYERFTCRPYGTLFVSRLYI